ncbi:dimethylamine monooxygenase subunit DmmA family protein [Saccharomonospora sp. NPDC006951]
MMAFGDVAIPVLRAWAESVPSKCPLRTLCVRGADEAALAVLKEWLAGARVGWRLMLAGPEIDVFAARSEAVTQGAIDAEIRMFVTSADRKRIYCPHCRTVTEAVCAVGQRMPCQGCGGSLRVDAHVSRHHGAYLGVCD